MTIFYHGTDIISAFSIASDGAILSPWYQRIKEFTRTGSFRDLPLDELEQLAFDSIKGGYGDHEYEHRVKSVSLDSNLAFALNYACNKYYSGIVLGLEHISEEGLVYVFKKVDLNRNLKTVHIPEDALRHEAKIREAYSTYGPSFFIANLQN